MNIIKTLNFVCATSSLMHVSWRVPSCHATYIHALSLYACDSCANTTGLHWLAGALDQRPPLNATVQSRLILWNLVHLNIAKNLDMTISELLNTITWLQLLQYVHESYQARNSAIQGSLCLAPQWEIFFTYMYMYMYLYAESHNSKTEVRVHV